jgi:hypothetical protein
LVLEGYDREQRLEGRPGGEGRENSSPRGGPRVWKKLIDWLRDEFF